ncbi:MAG: phosphopantetheine adenylyltransferase [Haloferacaceae archaeon]
MRVAVAGTFGPIHDGHRALFERALELGDEGVLVGLTSDDLARETRHEPRPVPPLEERLDAVRAELDDLDRWGRDVAIRTLDHRYDVAAWDPSLDALVVSPETEGEVVEVNRRRRQRGLAPLEAVVVPFVRADDGERISSTRIVRGEVDEHGALLE